MNNITFTRRQAVFLSAWVLFSFSVIFEMTMWGSNGAFAAFLKAIRYLAYLLCVVSFIDEKSSPGIIAKLFITIVLFLLGVVVCRNTTLFLYMFILMGAINIQSDIIIGSSAVLSGVLILVTVVSSRLGLIQDYLFGDMDRIRHGLGFTWTTTGSVLFVFFVLEYIYVRNRKMKVIEYVILELISIYFYVYTDSRMAFYLSTAFLVFCMLFAGRKFFGTILGKLEKLCLLMPTFICLFAIWLHGAYSPDNPGMAALNKLLSGRLKLGKSAIETYGFPILGKQIEWVGYSVKADSTLTYNYVDCSYLQIMFSYGIIILAVVIAFYTILMYRAYKRKDVYLILIIIFILVFSITEPRLFHLAFNPFPVLLLSDLKVNNLSGGENIQKNKEG